MLALVVFGGIVIGVFVFAAGIVVGRASVNRQSWPTNPHVIKDEDKL